MGTLTPISGQLHESATRARQTPRQRWKDLEGRVLDHVKANPLATADDIRGALGVANQLADKVRRSLVREGRLVREQRVGYVVPKGRR